MISGYQNLNGEQLGMSKISLKKIIVDSCQDCYFADFEYVAFCNLDKKIVPPRPKYIGAPAPDPPKECPLRKKDARILITLNKKFKKGN